MNDQKNIEPDQKTGKKILRRIIKWGAISLGSILVLLVIGYAVITSSWGIKTFILPSVSDAAQEPITAEEVNVSLLNSTVSVKNLIVGKADKPLLNAKTVSCSYDLGAILDGNIKLSRIRLAGVKGSYVQTENTAQSADKKPDKTPSEKKSPAKSPDNKDSGGVTIDLNDIKISNTDYTVTLRNDTGTRTIEFKNTELSCERFANDHPAKINVSSAVNVDSKELKLTGLFSGDCLVKVKKDWQLEKALFATPTIVLFENAKEVSRFTGYNGDKARFWKWLGFRLLTPEQRKIAFEEGTERPFTGSHLDETRPGYFVDPITGAKLFRSDTKFKSNTGWPSFFSPLEGAITEHSDTSLGMSRTEVRSASSGIHLGHVFNDGPAPTYKRYCINGNVLKFVPDETSE